MALLNEVLVGRFNRFAQKLLSMKGPAALPQLRAEMGMNFTVQRGAEDRYLEGWDLFGVNVVQATPGVGNVARICLRNPAGSNVIAVVTVASMIDPTAGTSAASQSIAINRNATTDQNTVTAAGGWDLRGRPSSTCIVSTNSGAPAATGGTQVLIANRAGPANQSVDFVPADPDSGIPISPGVALQMFCAATNTAGNFTLWWRERFLEDSERA